MDKRINMDSFWIKSFWLQVHLLGFLASKPLQGFDDALISLPAQGSGGLPPDPLHYPTSVLTRKKKGIAPPKHPFQYNGIFGTPRDEDGMWWEFGGKGY